MKKTLANRILFILTFVIVAGCWVPALRAAEQSTAMIKELNGDVLVSGRTFAQIGTHLYSGDTIQTQTGASVILQLAGGSRLALGEKTNVDIIHLHQVSAKGAWESYVKLAWGQIRISLSTAYQKSPESTFEVETPDIVIAMKASRPDIEILYDPLMCTTMIFRSAEEALIAHADNQQGIPVM
jgi:hypothetical protein